MRIRRPSTTYSARRPLSAPARAAAIFAAALALGAWAAVAQAHDFWIQPKSFSPTADTTVDLKLVIGHDKERTEYPRNITHIRAFLCFDPSGTMRDVPGEHGQIAGQLPVKEPGLHMVVYASSWSPAFQTPEKFAGYLKKEDLKEALVEHDKRMAALKTAGRTPPEKIREYFSRCAKSLLAVAGKTNGKHDREVGLPLEIVAETNPLVGGAGTSHKFRVLLNGKPLARARLAAYREQKPEAITETRTDSEGRASLVLDEPGMWIVRCIRIEHVGKPAVDWQSIWATLTFERKAAGSPK